MRPLKYFPFLFLFILTKESLSQSSEPNCHTALIMVKEIQKNHFSPISIDDKILNKPASYQEAFEMLELLSEKSHQVITGVCISGKEISKLFHVVTTVTFKKFTSSEIKFYIENHKPYDKAGGYGIQEWIGLIGMEKLEGSYFNVVGPSCKRAL